MKQLNIKRNILLNPGPATTTDTVKMALVVPDICPREQEFIRVMQEVCKDLTKIVNGENGYTTVILGGSGTAIMDMVINSVVPPEGKIAIIINGAYGDRMVKIAKAYKIPVVEIRFGYGCRIDLNTVKNFLNQDPLIKCVAVVHHETTTGILNPVTEIGQIVKEHGSVYIVDAISSFAGVPIDIKTMQADFLLSTSNKCIQGMAGVAFAICKINELERINKYPPRSFYLNLYPQYLGLITTGQSQFTPPVQIIYALQQAIKEYFKEGEQNRHNRYLTNWRILRQGLIDLGFEIFSFNEEDESHLLITVYEPKWPKFQFRQMHDFLYQQGFTIYPGKITEQATFRVAIIGEINSRDIHSFLSAMEIYVKEAKI